MKKLFILATIIAFSLTCFLLAQAAPVEKDGEKDTEESKEPVYRLVAPPTAIDREPDEFADTYVRIQDYFGKSLSKDGFEDLLDRSDRRRLKEQGVSPETHYIFTTHATKGSNAICFVRQDNEDAKRFFQGPTLTALQIHLLGKIGKRIVTDEGIMTLIRVDRIKVGHTPFETEKKVEKRKEIYLTIEYEVVTPTGVSKRPYKKYKIPEAGKEYRIPDPYDPNRVLYMTFEF